MLFYNFQDSVKIVLPSQQSCLHKIVSSGGKLILYLVTPKFCWNLHPICDRFPFWNVWQRKKKRKIQIRFAWLGVANVRGLRFVSALLPHEHRQPRWEIHKKAGKKASRFLFHTRRFPWILLLAENSEIYSSQQIIWFCIRWNLFVTVKDISYWQMLGARLLAWKCLRDSKWRRWRSSWNQHLDNYLRKGQG